MKKTYLKTLNIRVKDKHKNLLNKFAYEVNQIWNYTNSITKDYTRVEIPGYGIYYKQFTAFDLNGFLLKYRKERNFNIHSSTVLEISNEHHTRRKQFKKIKLKWRASSGTKKALGWIPFQKGCVQYKNGQIVYMKNYIKLFDHIGLSKYDIKNRPGNFSQDSRGRWYFNVVVECDVEENTSRKSIGIDLGLKDLISCSDGFKSDNPKFYREFEEKLGKAQRAKKSKLVKTISAKIKNRRKDFLHKLSNKLVKENAYIFVGDVSSSKLAKTNMVKSVYDSGWHMLKTQLKYKAIARSTEFVEVNENYTTQVCSCCLEKSDNSPKGMGGLEIREWVCSKCGTKHDRDINAAKNILRLGHESLVEGFT